MKELMMEAEDIDNSILGFLRKSEVAEIRELAEDLLILLGVDTSNIKAGIK